MKNGTFLAFGAAVVLAVTFGACNCGNPAPGDEDDGGSQTDAGPTTDGGYDGSIVDTDGGPGSECLPAGHPCSAGAGGVCCSGVCDQATGACKAADVFCGGPGSACTGNLDCCTNNCVNGTCDATQCQGIGSACSGNADCCSSTCTNGACAQVPGATCGTLGEACSGAGDCCSQNCQGGVCVRAYYCQADGDLCTSDNDCCGRSCSKNDGTAGLCQTVSGGGGGTCLQGGNPCGAGGNPCCSRICTDPGTGVTVCQPASGCALTGAYCDTAQDCCGGGSNPNGSVQCTNNRCDNGQSCNPVGNTCGAQVLADGGSIPESQNCCDGRKEVCRVDSSGIPRCFGGGSVCDGGYNGSPGCCIPTGELCQFKDQCCGGAPCVPGADGLLRCTTNTCQPLGATCDIGDAGCCSGYECLGSGELGSAACQIPPTASDGGGTVGDDGGTGADGGGGSTCKPNGSTCATSTDCCSTICDNGTCQTPVSCQPEGSICTASSDCCTGFACNVPSGQSTGTCQQASCPSAGQACSPASGCCSGLLCLQSSGATCDGTTACTCTVTIN